VHAIRFLASDAIGADVSAARMNNFTPLHAAAMQGMAEVCAILLELGAQPDVQTMPQGYTPLHSAAWGGHGEVVEALLRAGARTDLLNYRSETPAQTARRQGRFSVAERLEADARDRQPIKDYPNRNMSTE
jgi:cytohesin